MGLEKNRIDGDVTTRTEIRAGRKGLLTEEQVLAIRADRRPQVEIASEYKISQTLINHIKRRRVYKWIEGPKAYHNKIGPKNDLASRKNQRFSEADVLVIRADRRPQRAIALDYKISATLVSKIKRHELYSSVEGPSAYINPPGQRLESPSRRGFLSVQQIRDIRADNRAARVIACDFGVSRSMISAIKRRKTYRWVIDTDQRP